MLSAWAEYQDFKSEIACGATSTNYTLPLGGLGWAFICLSDNISSYSMQADNISA